MIEVTDSWWEAIITAAVAGLVGGLVYELLLSRFGDAGMLERFGRVGGDTGQRRYVDLGFLSPMIIGAVAAVAFLYFMPPTDVLGDDGAVVRREYDPFRLIPGALIVGSAGGAFLSAMQERLKRVVEQTTNANARAVLAGAEPAAPADDGGAAGGLVPQGAGGTPSAGAVSRESVDAALRVLGG